MNSLVMKHRPKDTTKEQWEQTWSNSGHVFRTLIEVLKEVRAKDNITEEELKHPNIHDKLIWDTSNRRTIDMIISMISLDKENK